MANTLDILYAQAGGRCWYCGCDMHRWNEDSSGNYATVEHMTPKCRGGTDRFENLVAACKPCNSRKRRKTLEEYRHYLLCQDEKAKATEKLLSVIANNPALPEKAEVLRAAGRLLNQVDPITFYGEANEQHESKAEQTRCLSL